MRFILKLLIAILISSFMWGCTTTPSPQPQVINEEKPSYVEVGKASFYANSHQSKKTASGEIYDHELLTAAHKKLSFGTNVRVTNLENGKSVLVKINDRGPFIKGRIIDLSQSAFTSIASKSVGVIEVKIEASE